MRRVRVVVDALVGTIWLLSVVLHILLAVVGLAVRLPTDSLDGYTARYSLIGSRLECIVRRELPWLLINVFRRHAAGCRKVCLARRDL